MPPPARPVWPPWGTMGTWAAAQRRTISATSAVELGFSSSGVLPRKRRRQSTRWDARSSAPSSQPLGPTTALRRSSSAASGRRWVMGFMSFITDNLVSRPPRPKRISGAGDGDIRHRKRRKAPCAVDSMDRRRSIRESSLALIRCWREAPARLPLSCPSLSQILPYRKAMLAVWLLPVDLMHEDPKNELFHKTRLSDLRTGYGEYCFWVLAIVLTPLCLAGGA